MPSISLCVWAILSKLFEQQTFGILSKVFHKQKNNKTSNPQNRGDKDRFLVGQVSFTFIWGTRWDKGKKEK